MLKKKKKTVVCPPGRFLVNNVDYREETEKANKVVTSLCKAEGFELVHIEHRDGPKGRMFRVYIDKPGGITLDDCASLSRNLGDILDVEWANCGSYHLEVSSPGIERSLNKLDDFTRFCGEKVKIKLVNSINSGENLCGEILGVFEKIIRLNVGSKIITIEYGNVARARLMVFDGDN